MENLFKKRQDRLHVFEKFRNPQSKPQEPKEIPDYVFKNCERCGENIPYMELQKSLYVCPRCGCHMKISARERIRQLLDEGSFRERDALVESQNEDQFVGYEEKLDKAKTATGMHEAVICGSGTIMGYGIAIAVMDSRFMMGSMGHVVGDKIGAAHRICGSQASAAAHQLHQRRGTHAGGHRIADADGQDERGIEALWRAWRILYQPAHAPDDGRGQRQLCDAGRCDPG